MARLRNHVIGITVISAGVCGALPFRNESIDSPATPSPEVAQQQIDLLQDTERQGISMQNIGPKQQLQLNLSVAAPHALPTTEPELVSRPATLELSTTGHIQTAANSGSIEAPPKVANRFEPLVTTRPASQEPQPDNTLVIIDRLHRITDGDTLESLAERYLGDGTRWREILKQNETLLAGQDLLPIGEDLRIYGARSTRATHSAVQSNPETARALVPISRTPSP